MAQYFIYTTRPTPFTPSSLCPPTSTKHYRRVGPRGKNYPKSLGPYALSGRVSQGGYRGHRSFTFTVNVTTLHPPARARKGPRVSVSTTEYTDSRRRPGSNDQKRPSVRLPWTRERSDSVSTESLYGVSCERQGGKIRIQNVDV